MIECKQHLLPLSMRAVPPAKARELLRCRRKHWRQLFLKKHFSDQNLWRFSALASPEGINANAIVSAHQIMVVGEHGIKLKKYWFQNICSQVHQQQYGGWDVHWAIVEKRLRV